VLDDKNADRGRRGFERHPQPSRTWRPYEFDFALRSQTIELRLRNQHCPRVPKDESRASPVQLLRGRRGIELVGEKGKVKSVGAGVVQRHEAVLRVEDFLQRLVDAEQQLIQVGGFVEGVNDVGNDLALRLQALQFGDVEKADDHGPEVGIVQIVVERSFERAPRGVPALKPAA
jgi:hypothetical protein